MVVETQSEYAEYAALAERRETIDAEVEFDQGDAEDIRASVFEECRKLVEEPSSSYAARFLQFMVVVMIVCSTCCVFSETVPELEKEYYKEFQFFELVLTVFFTIELVTKLFVHSVASSGRMSSNKAMGFAIDLVATLPWYIDRMLRHFDSCPDTRRFREESDAIQLLRILRVLRLMKAAKQHGTVHVIMQCVWETLDGIFALLVFLAISTALSSCLVFFLEYDEPDTDFYSIPAAVWWALPTITGVGYGDMLPRTWGGKVVGAVTMVIGVLITSLVGAVMTHPVLEHFEKKMTMMNWKVELEESLEEIMRKGETTKSQPFPEESSQSNVNISDETERTHSSMRSELVSLPQTVAHRIHSIEKHQEALKFDMQKLMGLFESVDIDNDSVLQAERSSVLSSVRQLSEQQKFWLTQWRNLLKLPEFQSVIGKFASKEKKEASSRSGFLRHAATQPFEATNSRRNSRTGVKQSESDGDR